jgi:uncharacterized protein YbjT (DUF2867 family)
MQRESFLPHLENSLLRDLNRDVKGKERKGDLSMAEKKIIAVLGATGSQGGGLVRSILNDRGSNFLVRALTRDPLTEKAKALAKLGADVVAANIDDAESLKKAFDGAYGAYCVTFFWEHFAPERELKQAAAMALAAKHAGLQHVIWSTLEDTRQWVPLESNQMPTLMGSYKVPHFDAKGEANLSFIANEVPTTFLLTSFYWDNFIGFGMGPKRDASGKLTLTLPMGEAKLPGIVAEDIGRCAYGIFQKGPEAIGKTYGIAGEHLTGTQIADAFARVLHRDVHYRDISPKDYRNLGFPGSQDLGNMFQFKRDFNEMFCKARNVDVARSLNPSLQSLEYWLTQNKSTIESAVLAS